MNISSEVKNNEHYGTYIINFGHLRLYLVFWGWAEMKAVLISNQPKWVEKIANGKKTIEVRKTAPKQVPFKCYIYVTKDKPYLYRVDDDDNFELTNTLRPKVYWYVKDYNEQNGKVIGEFICDKIDEIVPDYNPVTTKFYYGYVADTEATCLSEEELQKYGKNKSLYFWHISDLKIYDKPKELSEFGLTRPPQSWQYVEEL